MSKKRKKPLKKSKIALRMARIRRKTFTIRPKVVKKVLRDLRATGYDARLLKFYHEVGEISLGEVNKITALALSRLQKQTQAANFKILADRVTVIRYHVKRHWARRASAELAQLRGLLPKLLSKRMLGKKQAQLLSVSTAFMARKLVRPPAPPKPKFRPLIFRDLRDIAVARMKAGLPIYPSDLEAMELASTKSDFRRFLKSYGATIEAYQQGLEEAAELARYGYFTPCLEIFGKLERKFGEIKIGKLGNLWKNLSMLDEEGNPYHTLLGWKPNDDMGKIFRKTNKRVKKIYIFGLFQWISPSEHPTFGLETGDTVIWGHEWFYKKGTSPQHYLPKVYRPSGTKRRAVTGREIDIPQIEQLYHSRFAKSEMLRFVKFLGLYVPVVNRADKKSHKKLPSKI